MEGDKIHENSDKITNEDGLDSDVVEKIDNGQELILYVQKLLKDMQDRFQSMSESIVQRIDEMGDKIDDLQNNITQLMTQSSLEEDISEK